ncbi:prepilin-type N-terminal cleavage/methylation domain-containing protein [Pelagibius sp. CAU 1746]|uniref:prepilin-type N-terminal cleavage/methylation domain-containing protein n=1 Tax=Pelagibius sp. CAU 1746 TaxID=3140370 RepID=UPI00325B48E2
MTGARPQRRRQAGFTLMELLVSITVLALLSVMMVGGLNFGARVWERTESIAQDQGRVAAVQALLRRQIAQMQPQQVRGADRRPGMALEGKAERLVFIGPVPEYLGQGGYYVVAVESEAAGPTRNLVLRWEPFTRERPGLNFSDRARKEVLLTGVRSVGFKYFGRGRLNQPTGWLTSWNDSGQLPELVEITVDFDTREELTWPVLAAAVVTEPVQR